MAPTNSAALRVKTGPMMTSQTGQALPGVPMNAQQMAEKHHQQQAALERSKLRARKPTDKTMPDGVEDCVMSDGVQRYRDLRDFERRLDATITRKRLDVMDSVNRNAKVGASRATKLVPQDGGLDADRASIQQRFKTLRIWISNTVEDQAWQSGGLNVESFNFSTNNESSFKVKIEGRLLDDDDDDDEDDLDKDEQDGAKDGQDQDKMDTDAPAEKKAKEPAEKKAPQPRFSHFFKAITVDFDRSKQRHGVEHSVEWKKPERLPNSANPPPTADFDEFVFKRNGDENMNITINLYRDESPERFELTPELADVVDMTVATRAEVVMALWEYIKLMGLQEEEEKRQFRCDQALKKVRNGPLLLFCMGESS